MSALFASIILLRGMMVLRCGQSLVPFRIQLSLYSSNVYLTKQGLLQPRELIPGCHLLMPSPYPSYLCLRFCLVKANLNRDIHCFHYQRLRQIDQCYYCAVMEWLGTNEVSLFLIMLILALGSYFASVSTIRFACF